MREYSCGKRRKVPDWASAGHGLGTDSTRFRTLADSFCDVAGVGFGAGAIQLPRNMQLSAAGLELPKRSEGFRSHTCNHINGFPTAGYGHRLLDHESFPVGISEAQAARILAADLRSAEQAIAGLVKVPLTQGQFDALVDFCFNLGMDRLASSTLLRVLNGGRYADAASSC